MGFLKAIYQYKVNANVVKDSVMLQEKRRLRRRDKR
jgi:hypothetical protein